MSLRKVLLWGGLVLVGPVLAQAPAPQAEPLTVKGAVVRALQRHPEVLAARQRLHQAEARLGGARALPNPELDLGHGQSVSGPGAANTDQDIQLTQRLTIFGQQAAATEKARVEVEIPRIELTLTEQEIAYRVRTAWYDLQAAQAAEGFAQQTLGVGETFARLAQAQYKAGEVPIANVLRSEFEVESARQALLVAQTEVRVASATLSTLLQQPLEKPLVVPPLREVTLNHYDPASLLRQQEQQPQVQAARMTVAAQKAGIVVAKSASKPELAVVYAHNQLQSWQGGNSYRIGVTFPLWDRGQIRASVQEAQAGVAEKEATLTAVQQQVRLELTTAIYCHEQAQELVHRTGGVQLERAVRLYQLAEKGYREGATSYLSVLDALGVLRSAYQSYVKALTDYTIAEAGLERALGGPLPTPQSTEPQHYTPPMLTPVRQGGEKG